MMVSHAEMERKILRRLIARLVRHGYRHPGREERHAAAAFRAVMKPDADNMPNEMNVDAHPERPRAHEVVSSGGPP